MAYDEGLAERVRDMLNGKAELAEKKMFGGLCFMVSGHMCCGILGDTLMARVGPEQYKACLRKPYASEMDFTGRPMKGLLYVRAEGVAEDVDLSVWLDRCLDFVHSLPDKQR
ncbi:MULTISPECIES: TfoX/Sxy family protein [Marinobacter]|uniref:TfoX/Sxy family protein n=1 Tax=Marinobacter suaedae TaxID=3057675 RepID=A0ABT8W0Z7_9GAMM|nr:MULTISPECIES: TfoX/Sxy family protein [unclassified Marinobacter]MBZ2169938.1 TfoX/Sxy family protein [Marinobacter sp. F4216]MDO3721918.1 TfoX/Sxy family protein [Marinobacter sp. chi1]